MPEAAIVDYGMGNLYSVERACRHAGLQTRITSDKDVILNADAVVLPGVGAFGDAMGALNDLGLAQVLKDAAGAGKPLLGICLGLQLLMSESHEFGLHQGLGLLEGDVVRLEESVEDGRRVKVPHVGWNLAAPSGPDAWRGTLLEGVSPGEPMYFVHSFFVRPRDAGVVLARTRYGVNDFCSALQRGNVFGCQYHPEKSGPQGMRFYKNLAARAAEGGKHVA